MTEEWIDITDYQKTNIYKKIAIIRFVLKIGILAFFTAMVIAVARVIKQIAPYVSNPDLVLDTVWTNSQLTAVVVLIFLCFILIIFSRMITRLFRLI